MGIPIALKDICDIKDIPQRVDLIQEEILFLKNSTIVKKLKDWGNYLES